MERIKNNNKMSYGETLIPLSKSLLQDLLQVSVSVQKFGGDVGGLG